ncbi:TPA: GspH/FimT family pseudopilin, partial [Enterobacter roggenkampii]|nr:GspH/FimT family pseudopilin [Enterobacter roggenkampii]
YGSDRAVMDGNIVGLVIATDKYQLVTLDDKNGERHWVPLSAGRITTKGDFPEEMHVSLSPQRLAANVEADPQILFLPDGEIGRFTLTLQSYDKQHHFRVVSQGAAPVSVENDD